MGGNAAAARLSGINVDRIRHWALSSRDVRGGHRHAPRLAARQRHDERCGQLLLTAFAAVFLGSATLGTASSTSSAPSSAR